MDESPKAPEATADKQAYYVARRLARQAVNTISMPPDKITGEVLRKRFGYISDDILARIMGILQSADAQTIISQDVLASSGERRKTKELLGLRVPSPEDLSVDFQSPETILNMLLASVYRHTREALITNLLSNNSIRKICGELKKISQPARGKIGELLLQTILQKFVLPAPPLNGTRLLRHEVPFAMPAGYVMTAKECNYFLWKDDKLVTEFDAVILHEADPPLIHCFDCSTTKESGKANRRFLEYRTDALKDNRTPVPFKHIVQYSKNIGFPHESYPGIWHVGLPVAGQVRTLPYPKKICDVFPCSDTIVTCSIVSAPPGTSTAHLFGTSAHHAWPNFCHG